MWSADSALHMYIHMFIHMFIHIFISIFWYLILNVRV